MDNITRRELLGSAAIAGGLMMFGGKSAVAQTASTDAPIAEGPYELPPLPYNDADLEPFIDAQTVRLHHNKHHAGYVTKANEAFRKLHSIREKGGETILEVGEITRSLQFNLSGHILHSIFWTNMKKDGGGSAPSASDIGKMITQDFGSYRAFEAQFCAASQQIQGSGWGMLAYDPLADRLLVLQAEMHQNPAVWMVPLLVCDVWEHAYYLKYENRRSDFIKAFMNVVNWDNVNDRLATARKQRG